MKRYFFIFSFLISTFYCFAQKQANIWYFGNRAGLDFNQIPPQPLNNSNLNSVEGTSSIADNNGKLLFYTNGLAIMNRKHLLMKNGGALAGHPSSTNNAVIVPLPGNDSIYYVFTTGAANEANQQFQYNIVNMKGDGGLGEVEPGGMNAIIEDKIFEKLAAIKHCNNKDTWIVVHKWNSDEYHSYLLTAAGLSLSPVVSNTGLIIGGYELNELGTLKFSAKGSKFVAVHPLENDGVELMDFDNTTGIFSNPIVFHPNVTPLSLGVYGAEFSPDGRLLYVTSNDYEAQKATLYQFDITSHNVAAIEASKQIIHQNTDFLAGNLQIGPDLKMYMAMFNDTSVSVIENPNTYGTGCNFVYNKIYLGTQSNTPVQYGLPTFVQSYFDTSSNPYDFTRLPGNCLDRNITFKINRLSGIDSVKWNFGDSQQSQALQPTHMYATPGFYDVKLIVYKIDCSGLNDTIVRKIWIADSDTFLGADTSSCSAFNMEIGVEEIFGVNYLWNTGLTSNKITTSGFGDYWLEMEQNGCKIRDSIKVSQMPKPTVSLGRDTNVCKSKPVILKTVSANYDSYLWSTGETTSSIQVNQIGTYHVTISKNFCEASDTIQVLVGDCDVYIPSAFTPNNDNLNETFGVVDNTALQFFSLQIYNKWGQLIFNSNDVTKKWDGTFKGKNMPNGTYVWMLNYTNIRGRKFYEQGTVMLIR
ncbi:MAG: gliding motility-associated C-terminal domain-containing protein [Chitinophagaceae bacterium]|nr:gliding motility-associated C-terminal domain-containing protein [Chitinophagaceae bacterium]